MAEYAYTTVPGKIKVLLQKIRSVGVPQKVNTVWLKTIGFTSSNDKSLVPILKQIGLIDGAGSPTGVWTKFRGANHKAVLGDAIRTGYIDLFSVYPDANVRPVQDITNFFKTSSTAGDQAVAKTVATFRAFSEEAEFKAGDSEVAEEKAQAPANVLSGADSHDGGRQKHRSPSLHIDIQIHISSDSTPDQVDHIFKSMARHLYGQEGD